MPCLNESGLRPILVESELGVGEKHRTLNLDCGFAENIKAVQYLPVTGRHRVENLPNSSAQLSFISHFLRTGINGMNINRVK